MKKPINLIVMLLLLGGMVVAQQATTEFPKLTGPYLGQKPPGMIPELFAPGIVSTEHFEHSSPTFAPDGKEVFWSVHYPDSFSHSRPIVFMKKVKNRWTVPQIAPFVKSEYKYENPFFSFDGNRTYFSANPTGSKGSKESDLWYVERTRTGWSEQMNLSYPPNSDDIDAQPSLSACGNLYFISFYDKSDSKFGLYSSSFSNNEFSKPVLLEEKFNSGIADWTPYIARDESYLIFSSFRKDGYGSGDLYVAFKMKDGTWGEVINMGEKINTEANERFPQVSPDGKYLFFNSTRKIAGAKNNEPGNGNGDVYWVSSKIIDDLKPEELK